MVAKLGDLDPTNDIINAVPLTALLLAAVAASISVCAAVYTESLYKTAGEDFLEQQFWLYLYGALVATAVHLVTVEQVNPLVYLAALALVTWHLAIDTWHRTPGTGHLAPDT